MWTVCATNIEWLVFNKTKITDKSLHLEPKKLPLTEVIQARGMNETTPKKIKRKHVNMTEKLAKLRQALSEQQQLVRFRLVPENMSMKVKVKLHHMGTETIE